MPSPSKPSSRPLACCCPISSAAIGSMLQPCARRWRPPSALPMRPAPGIGKRPMTPARRDRIFLRKYGARFSAKPGLRQRAFPRCRKSPTSADAYGRSTESQTFQQFSTPIPLGLVAAHAGAITPADRVLEPSAGTGLLAILNEIVGGALVLNELAEPAPACCRFSSRPFVTRRRGPNRRSSRSRRHAQHR